MTSRRPFSFSSIEIDPDGYPVITNSTATFFETLMWMNTSTDINETLSFTVCPNPSDESVNVFISSESNQGFTAITIADVSGRTVFATRTKQQFTTIDISGLQSGCYFVNVEDAVEERGTQRLMVR